MVEPERGLPSPLFTNLGLAPPERGMAMRQSRSVVAEGDAAQSSGVPLPMPNMGAREEGAVGLDAGDDECAPHGEAAVPTAEVPLLETPACGDRGRDSAGDGGGVGNGGDDDGGAVYAAQESSSACFTIAE